ncbi:cytochrome d ubiquinol oxidase subunit II [Segniliparus rugosus]|uniref:Cytochrome d ubiquinol oxidase, subunit II n=1 Tax=Segniliparus rugosus (strain ATCC BAA-974 / DSM 45345 / CCUG 50838 / CIP 108380 / JCM 13579 / CDC 945) TaxID=679197 RepID=E5XN66_SEGRC|nr:cytochrome d ubiquinol oxidase subunit II [Segniliparus rugosus]EFV14214.1 cytochrome d ubiquinol oxidase, subunit II [Segniliparus rugosus ATCC BAA-974]
MDLPHFWFLLVAVFFGGYFLLEGFDFGVGMLMPILGRSDEVKRRVLLNTIGPVWDGNEVWVITGAGAMFAAFPQWYATLFSGFYLPLLLILFGLIVRVVSIEWRGKIEDPRWRRWCDVGIGLGSWLPAILWGIAFTDIAVGVPLDENGYVTGGLPVLLRPVALLGGAATCLLFLLHGAVFVALKTEGEIRVAARRLAVGLVAGAAPVVLLLGWTVSWALGEQGRDMQLPFYAAILSSAALLAAALAVRLVREGWAFALTGASVLALAVLFFGSLYPNLVASLPYPERSVTIESAASSPYTLKVMAWAALGTAPFVLVYQGWSYWVFRKRISAAQIPPSIGLSPRLPAPGKAGEPDGNAGDR